jgi:CheY-like chemotaxis protein
MSQKLKRRILSVDDDPGIGMLLARIFENTGRFTVALETDSFRAMETARRFRPDLLLVDINMPGKTGVQLAMQLRSEPWLRYRPIVFFTVLSNQQVPTSLTLGDGPTEFLSKGVPTEVIIATVDRLLSDSSELEVKSETLS